MAAITGAILRPAQVQATEVTVTPSAFSATEARFFASTVSGAVLMGYGTTFDVALKNRAGTTVLGIGPNSTTTTLAGALVCGGTISTTSTGSGALFSAVGTSTAARYLIIENSAGQMIVGSEGATGSSLITGAAAYDAVLRGLSGIAFSADQGTTLHLRIASTGAVAVAGTLSVGATPATAGAIRIPTNQSLVSRNAANNANVDVITLNGDNDVMLGGSGIGGKLVLASFTTGTTVGAAGAGSALPATPEGYFQIRFSAGGTVYKVPFYLT